VEVCGGVLKNVRPSVHEWRGSAPWPTGAKRAQPCWRGIETSSGEDGGTHPSNSISGVTMHDNPFHLGWFLAGSNAQGWNKPWSGNIGTEWMRPDLYVHVARELERAGFDYILLEDNVFVADTYKGSMDIYLQNAIQVPRIDPVMMAPWMLQATKHIGIVPTISTFAYHPYLLARLIGSMDQLSGGRAGWNVVTGSSDRAVQNFGFERMAEHDLRYEIAGEFVDTANALWDSWEPGAVIADQESGIFVDPTKVRTVDISGAHYSTRGPLNSGPAPQGRPVLAQAGNSPRGRTFAAQYADTIVGSEPTVARMKAFRDDVRERLVSEGRDPNSCKVLFVVAPVITSSDRDTEEVKRLRTLQAAKDAESTLAVISKTTGIDFGEFDLDAPLVPGTLTTNGSQQTLSDFVARNEGRTLREAATIAGGGTSGEIDLTGTAEQVAGRLGDINDELGGGDGFLIGRNDVSRRSIAEITDGLVPVLQRQGRVRTAYTEPTFRENLVSF
jgi:FMN-dependent oxidoreductase (nitrilotriacetate monooxygenase family)